MVQIQTPDPSKGQQSLEMVGFDDYFRVPAYKSITFLVLFVLSFILTLVMFVINIYKTFQVTHHQRVIMRQATKSFRRPENTEQDPDLLLDIGRNVSSPSKSDYPDESSTMDSLPATQLAPKQQQQQQQQPQTTAVTTAPSVGSKWSFPSFKSSAIPISSSSVISTGSSKMDSNLSNINNNINSQIRQSPGRQPSIGTLEFETPPQENQELFRQQFPFPQSQPELKKHSKID